jgi:histidine triad (HIT) family protein
MAKTVYQRIIDREIPAKIEHEDAECIVIHDIEPQAPVHLLIIPKRHVTRVSEASTADQPLLGHLLLTAQAMAKKLKLAAGFRLVINNGMHGGESVQHLHVHLLGGRQLSWPPG